MSCHHTTKSEVAKGWGRKLRRVHERKEVVRIRGGLPGMPASLATIVERRC